MSHTVKSLGTSEQFREGQPSLTYLHHPLRVQPHPTGLIKPLTPECVLVPMWCGCDVSWDINAGSDLF